MGALAHRLQRGITCSAVLLTKSKIKGIHLEVIEHSEQLYLNNFQLEKLLHEKRFQRKRKNGGKVAINVVESQPPTATQPFTSMVFYLVLTN